MYPFDKKYAEKEAYDAVNTFTSIGKYTTHEFVRHIVLMMSEINHLAFTQIEDKNFYSDSKYIRDKSGQPVCNFAKLCFHEKWDSAKCVGDEMNKAMLEHQTLYQDYVHRIKNSSEYISIQRNNKLLLLLD